MHRTSRSRRSTPAQIGPAEYVTGTALIEPLFDPRGAGAATVTFTPGARTAWHSHPAGQTLIVREGVGWVQERGGERRQIRPGDAVVLLSSPTPLAFAQVIDSVKHTPDVAGSVTLTNKGISIIPTYRLGKPAVVFDMSMGKRNLRFEPQLSFGLDGKPWSFLFWWRYKVLEADRFRLNVGAHPAISFKTTTKNTHFVALNANLANISLSNQLTMNVSPQVYYLQMADDDGFYFTSRFSLAKRDFPVSISALINKTIQTNIPAGEDFIWNVSVMYAFDI